MARLTPEKAKTILRDRTVRGEAITKRQRRFFGLIAGGGTPTKVRPDTTYRRNRAHGRARSV